MPLVVGRKWHFCSFGLPPYSHHEVKDVYLG